MFRNKVLLDSNIVKVFLTIDGIYYVVDHGFLKSPTKHDKNKLIETKNNTGKLRNTIET
jgi:HrpA-like RNA helicase